MNPAETSVAAIYSLALLVGLPLNVLSLWVLVHRHGLRSANRVIMTHLAASDLLLILTLPFRIYDFVSSQWPYGPVLCKVVTLVFRTNILSSSFFVTFISVDRMLAVSYPLRSRTLRTPRTSWMACAAVWLLAVTNCLPEINCAQRDNATACFRLNFMGDNSASPSPGNSNLSRSASSLDVGTCMSTPVFFYIFIICTLFLFVINLISTARVVQTLRKRKNGLMGHNVRKVVLLFTVNLLLFSCFFIPFIIVMLCNGIVMLQGVISSNVTEFLIAYMTLNCCLDPIVYYFSLDAFWGKKQDANTSISPTLF